MPIALPPGSPGSTPTPPAPRAATASPPRSCSRPARPVAVGVYLPARAVRAAIVMAMALAVALCWPRAWASFSPVSPPTPNAAPCSPCFPSPSGPPQPCQGQPCQGQPCQRRRPDIGGPSWLTGVFAAASIAVAVYCAARPRRGPPLAALDRADTDGAHVVVASPWPGSRLRPARPAQRDLGSRLRRGRRLVRLPDARGRRGARPGRGAPPPLPHLVECAAIVFMFLVLPASAGEGRARPAA